MSRETPINITRKILKFAQKLHEKSLTLHVQKFYRAVIKAEMIADDAERFAEASRNTARVARTLHKLEAEKVAAELYNIKD